MGRHLTEFEEEVRDRFSSLLRDCYNMYLFLGVMFEKEVTVSFLKEMVEKGMVPLEIGCLQEIRDGQMRDGLTIFIKYIENLKGRDLRQAALELAVEYANLFLGLKGLPHPSESAYKSGSLMERVEDVLQNYWHAGVKVIENREPADHIAIELHFAAYLCQAAMRDFSNERINDAKRHLEMRKKFLDEHLLSWLPSFTGNLLKFAETDFYRGLALITERFVELDRILIDYMLAELSI